MIHTIALIKMYSMIMSMSRFEVRGTIGHATLATHAVARYAEERGR